MKLKSIVSLFTAAAVIGTVPAALPGFTAAAADSSAADVTKYSYQITPMMSPFNEYFYVKTDNPDPMGFRFTDKSTKYSEDGAPGTLSLNYDSWDREVILYSDVDYEDKTTGRVKGGYIFTGNNTDGGEVTLQYQKDISYSEYHTLDEAGDKNIGEKTEIISSSSGGNVGWQSYRIVGYYQWVDTGIKLKLPRLVDDMDYLVETYATKSSFFDNMSAVQAGLDSICLYSGSYVRGEVYRANKYWFLSNSPHIDQNFYIQQPYRRKDNKSLLATAIYPYRWDSYSFPRAMGSIATMLDPSATWKMNSGAHWLIDVTLNGETESYGGAGEGEGQGIDEDQIIKRFTFANGAETFDLTGARKLLNQYSALTVTDDYPHYDDLTWEQVLEKVGTAGAWVRLYSIYSVYGASGTGYSYLYQRPGKTSFPGYVSNGWVDGRYINSYEIWEPGAKLADHPTSSITLSNVATFETDPYYKEIKDVTKNVTYKYDKDNDRWEMDIYSYMTGSWYISNKAGYAYLKGLADEGKFDSKYLKNMILTREQVESIVDKNTDYVPKKGYIYDATTDPGTPFNYPVGDVNLDGEINMKDLTYFQRHLNGFSENAYMDKELGDTHKDNSIDMKDITRLQRYLNGWNEKLG